MRNGLVDYSPIHKMIELRAYYKWINGSTNSHTNWCDAEAEVMDYLRGRIVGSL